MSTDRTIDGRLHAAALTLDGAASDDTVRKALASAGYDDARLAEGRRLLDDARAAQNHALQQRGRQYGATDAYRTAAEAARAVYMQHLALARVACRGDRDARKALGLSGARRQSVAGWLAQARQFYTAALDEPALLAVLARVNLTPDQLREGVASVEAVRSANATQEQQKAAAMQATVQRDGALRALHVWMRDFRDVARAVFRRQPRQLEMLGLRTPSYDRTVPAAPEESPTQAARRALGDGAATLSVPVVNGTAT